MKINRSARLTVAGLVTLLFLGFNPVYGHKRAGTRAATERTLREVDAQWAAAAQARDFEKVISYYSATAIELPPNAPARKTKAEIHKSWAALINTPGASLNWEPIRVEVSESHDLGYIAGTYEYTEVDAAGKKVVDHGKYLQVMRKTDDGSWKCVAVSWNSDLPASAPKK